METMSFVAFLATYSIFSQLAALQTTCECLVSAVLLSWSDQTSVFQGKSLSCLIFLHIHPSHM